MCDWAKKDLKEFNKEFFLNFRKNDFTKDLKDISKEEFEESFFDSLDGHVQSAKKHLSISEMADRYIYVYQHCKKELRVLSVENKADKTNLICKEKLSAFYATSQEARAAFYDVRILKKIRDIYNVKCKEA